MGEALGMALPFITALLWGFHASLAKKGMERARGLEGGFFSLCSGALATAAYVALSEPRPQLTLTNFWNLAIAGFLNFALGTIAYFQAIDLSGASRATTLSSIRPFFGALFASLLVSERMTGWLALGTTFIVLGVCAVGGLGGSSKTRAGGLKGDALALTAAVFFGLNPIFIKWGMEGLEGPFLGVLVAMASGAAAYVPFLVLGGGLRRMALVKGRSALFLTLAGVASASANFAYYGALTLIPVTVVLPISNMYPFIATALGALFLKERLTLGFLLGATLIFLGVCLVIL